MAVPVDATLISISTEGLKKAGYSSPTSTQLARAQDEFVAEVKNDIVNVERRLTSLQTTAVMVTTNGQSRYVLPTDYLSDLSLVLLDGTGTGTAQAGTVGSITLAADDADEAGDIIGTDILITANTAKGSMSQSTGYDSTTKVNTVTPDFNSAPDSSSEYLKVTAYTNLAERPVWEYSKGRDRQIRGIPAEFYPVGDSDNGEFILFPVPFRDNAVPYGLQLRYYADLMEIDLTSTLMATLYKKWRNVFTLGVVAKQLQSDDDNRQEIAMGRYQESLRLMINREKYGYDLSNLNMTVQGY